MPELILENGEKHTLHPGDEVEFTENGGSLLYFPKCAIEEGRALLTKVLNEQTNDQGQTGTGENNPG